MAIKFYYNGIKVDGGKLQKCGYSLGRLLNYPEDTITIYARDYQRFPNEMREEFAVENNSDSQSDYFENDRIRVLSSHKYYNEILLALKKRQEKFDTKRKAA